MVRKNQGRTLIFWQNYELTPQKQGGANSESYSNSPGSAVIVAQKSKAKTQTHKTNLRALLLSVPSKTALTMNFTKEENTPMHLVNLDYKNNLKSCIDAKVVAINFIQCANKSVT